MRLKFFLYYLEKCYYIYMSFENHEKIDYTSPKESIEKGEPPQHRFDLIVNGEIIGAAEINYFSKPLPLYQLTALYVDFEQKGKGCASRILDRVEEFLKKRNKPGILVDAIMEEDQASGLYARRGWVEVPNSLGLYVFNWPKNISLDILNGYSYKYSDMNIRKGK